MTRLCRQILNKIRMISFSDDDLLMVARPNRESAKIKLMSGGSKEIDVSDLCHEVDSILDQLAIDGYIQRKQSPYFSLTHKGLHPYAVKWDTLKGFLFKSVAIPIVVSFFTTFITLFLKSFF